MKPKLICLTPVRNEAWILEAFLLSASLWADHIIIADQNSNDNSREIAKKFEKAILVQNNDINYNESERQKLLINEARKIPGDKILIALDADEIFTNGFQNTKDWKKIINSKPGDIFSFQWANITPDLQHYFLSNFHYPWAFHDDGTEHKNYARYMHSMRIPYPQDMKNSMWNKINDFKVLHFNYAHKKRLESKQRFYQCLVKINEPNKSRISLYRSSLSKIEKTYKLPQEWLLLGKNETNLLSKINLQDSIYWFDLEVLGRMRERGVKYFRQLNIWDKIWMAKMSDFKEVTDPRSWGDKLLHFYLKKTQAFSKSYLIKIIDKFFQYFFKK